MYIKEPPQPAQACVIWMHGLGSDASDMASLAGQLPLSEVAIRHVFINAPLRPVTLNNGYSMRAWYDILGTQLTDREDREGILNSQLLILQAIDAQKNDGFASNQIFLAGFSQGGAMALYTGLHMETPLAGVIALSAYLPLLAECKPKLNQYTPFFIACGRNDPLVLPAWCKHCIDWLTASGYHRLTYHDYPIEHSVCLDEIQDLSYWLTTQVKCQIKGNIL